MIGLTLLSTTDPPNKVEKTITTYTNITLNLKGDVDLLNPTIILDTSLHAASIMPNTNYAALTLTPTNIRYYFINGFESVTNNVYKLILKEDVLMTYAAQIKALKCTVARQENVRNGYLVDPEYNALCYKAYVTKAFPNAITNDSLYLITTG